MPYIEHTSYFEKIKSVLHQFDILPHLKEGDSWFGG